jgi:hypothetical protein
MTGKALLFFVSVLLLLTKAMLRSIVDLHLRLVTLTN